MKKLAQQAHMKLSEAMSTQQSVDIYTELRSVRESLSNSKEELKAKEKNIESLKIELRKAKALEKKLEEKDASLDKLKAEFGNAKAYDNALLEANSLLAEMELLKSELKRATKAEENSKKAMNGLALTLKEVTTEANQERRSLHQPKKS
ncbi:hypothetical protein CFOL_v3_35752 [Cephalotus follicularis]|uniref:Uncharacterized protein n=1 Tax=Cephalotus follicularis TaxID=3775 RepID=A0A1Q3DJ71_CEPFO|nr:hypothetical protein CFOL_v3_35752 [Cephalotus follicularis]